MNKQVFITNFSEETEKLGEEFAGRLQARDIVCLYGDLGSGKTTFVKGLAKGLGIKSRIISPTFILIRHHKIKINPSADESKIKNLFHIDLYRLESEDDIKGLGLEELFKDKDSIVVIEWAEKLGNFLPKNRWDVKFKYVSDAKRKIKVKKIS